MKVCMTHRPEITYPDGDDYYSPSIRYPEYKHDHISSKPNKVYDLVREILAQYGLDSKNFGTPAWNPLSDLIKPNSSVFILCNFVSHQGRIESNPAFRGKCTHGSVLRALLDYVLLAVGCRGNVCFGNAPLQSTDWDRVTGETGASTVLEFYQKLGIDVRAKDLRFYKIKRDIMGRTLESVSTEQREQAAEIELGRESLLSELRPAGKEQSNFRVADYDPRRMQMFHSSTEHRYVVNRELLSADVVISLPKLKTHEKVGVTCGLKGFVGIVGHKDCLPHHRLGGPQRSGDEYPYSSALMHSFSAYTDWVQRLDSAKLSTRLLQITDHSGRRILRRAGLVTSGAWHGNDTCWRMALDLARIAHYADSSGGMCDTMQRINLVLIDGIMAGEGDGPLTPKPVSTGALLLSDNVAMGDWIPCRLMGFSPHAIPIVREAFRCRRYPLCQSDPREAIVWFNGREITESQVRPLLGRSFRPPRGWRGYCEMTEGAAKERKFSRRCTLLFQNCCARFRKAKA